MKVFAIADLHLDGGAGKPMDVFGSRWERHRERIFDSWQSVVGAGDCVLIPGDICWAMRFEDAASDLEDISALNGTKLLLRGNHDFWWSSVTRMRSVLPSDIRFIQNDSVDMGEFCVAGSRGWMLPSDSDFTADDRKIYSRELLRLELSLSSVKHAPLICMTHFPPLSGDGADSEVTALLEKHDALLCVYGHIHGYACAGAFNGEKNGVSYVLCSADSIGFSPLLVSEF